jgi:hypothetical protein
MGFLANAFGMGSSGENWVAPQAQLQNTMTPEQIKAAQEKQNQALLAQQQLAQQLASQGGLQKQNQVYGQQQGLLGQQQDLATQLATMAQGGGPNPALAQLQQATGQNVAQQAALMGSARGASANAGLMARQAAQQGANIQQQAVGQGATMQAQQQLAGINALQGQQQAMAGNIGQMGGMANQQVANQMAGVGNYGAAAANQQAQMLGGMQTQNQQQIANQAQANSAQAGIEQQAAKGQQDTRGGIFSAIGKAVGAMAEGGQVQQQNWGSGQGAAQGIQSGVAKAAADNPVSKAIAWLSKSEGGTVPGHAQVQGDSYANDKVPTMLSPGEIVVPRSAAQDPEKASEFVKNIIDKKPNNYQGFEKVDATPTSTVLRNAAGHQIVIAHGALSPEHREMLDALPKYAKGGISESPGNDITPLEDQQAAQREPAMVVPQGTDSPPAEEGGFWNGLMHTLSGAGNAMREDMAAPGNIGAAIGTGVPNAMNAMTKQFDERDNARDMADQQMMAQQYGPGAAVKNASMEMPMSMGQPASTDPYTRAMGQMSRGLDIQQKAEQNFAEAKGKIADESMQFQQAQQAQYTKDRAALDAEHVQRIADYNAGKVNPDHYWENKTSGQKIRNTIGMILSGFGGTQSAKMFQDSMDNEIKQDIAAQESNLGQKRTLLEDNIRKYGDLETARKASYVDHANLVAAQLDRAAATAGSPEAAARAQMAKAQLAMTVQPKIDELAQRSSVMKMMAQAGSNADPSALAMLKPPAVQEKIAKDIDDRKELRGLKVGMMRSFKQLGDMANAGTLSPRDAASARNAFVGPLEKLFEGRYNTDAVEKMVDSLLPQGFEDASTRAHKMGRIEQLFDGFKKGSLSKMNGIDLDQFKPTSLKVGPMDLLEPADQQRAQWALNNRQNPTAQRLIKTLGLK